jgi:hypothetical protein
MQLRFEIVVAEVLYPQELFSSGGTVCRELDRVPVSRGQINSRRLWNEREEREDWAPTRVYHQRIL